MVEPKSKKKKCLVLDTNIWVYDTHLLRSPLGASLLFHISMGDFKIGLPEVVELEIFKHSLIVGKNAIENIKKNYEQIEILLGERDEYIVPTEDEISKNIRQRLKLIERHILPIPTTFEQYNGAMKRVLNEIPPNGPKNQQFKDSLIWESILELSKNYEVFFLTQDKGFYEKRDPRKGMAKELKEEITELGVKVKVFDSIDAFLSVIKPEVDNFNKDELNILLKEYLITNSRLENSLDGIILQNMMDSKLSLFLTEKPNILSVRFNVSFEAISRNDIKYRISIDGECSYSVEEKIITNLSLDSVIKYNPDGSSSVSKYLYSVASMGRGTKKYSFKKPL